VLAFGSGGASFAFLSSGSSWKLTSRRAVSCVPSSASTLDLGKRIVWAPDSLENFKYNIRRLTARSWGISMKLRFQKLSRYTRGWMNYYGLSKLYRPLPELDEWIRRRVRMCFMKLWRTPRTRIGNLLRLGASKTQAIPAGMSSKGPWRLARTYATQLGMNNAWLKEQGLVSVRELWIAFHYPNG